MEIDNISNERTKRKIEILEDIKSLLKKPLADFEKNLLDLSKKNDELQDEFDVKTSLIIKLANINPKFCEKLTQEIIPVKEELEKLKKDTLNILNGIDEYKELYQATFDVIEEEINILKNSEKHIIIEGKTQLKINTTETYDINNNYLGERFIFSVVDAITNQPTTNITIVSSTDTSVTIKANVSGKQIKVVATDSINNTISTSIIVSLSVGF